MAQAGVRMSQWPLFSDHQFWMGGMPLEIEQLIGTRGMIKEPKYIGVRGNGGGTLCHRGGSNFFTLQWLLPSGSTSIRWTIIFQLFSAQRLNLFRSGTSHMIILVTSSWHHGVSVPVIHPPSGGLVPIWLGLGCQFRGNWSQRREILTSESHSRWGDVASFYYFFQSHYRRKLHLSEFTSAFGAKLQKSSWCQWSQGACSHGACPLFFCFCYLSILFRPQYEPMDTLKEGDHWQMWEFIPI